MSGTQSSINLTKDGLYEQLLNSIDKRFDSKGCPDGMVKIAYDNHQYWYPEDHERYEKLVSQWSQLMSRNRYGLPREECERRDAQADEIGKEMDLIKSRQVEITDPEIIALREMNYKFEQEILRSLEADARANKRSNQYGKANLAMDRFAEK